MRKFPRAGKASWPIPLLAILLCGCFGSSLNETTPAHQEHAPSDWSEAAKSGDVPAGKARVYVFLGHWHFPEAQFDQETENLTAADVYLNQVDVGGINPGECLVLDLPPGAYSFAWLERSRHPYRAVLFMETLAAGQSRFLSIETEQHLNAEPEDALSGYFAEQQDGLSLVKPMTIVLPDEPAVDRAIAADAPSPVSP